jgi:uracil-DNA glycosylase
VAGTDNQTVEKLAEHVRLLRACRQCPKMAKPVVSGGAVVSRVVLVGQAPGDKEPVFGRPFAWTAGKTLFRWFDEKCGIGETEFRALIYMAAVCRCFPGKKPTGGDRVPSTDEVTNCAAWLDGEFQILRPTLVIPVGKLAIGRFLALDRLDGMIGRQFQVRRHGSAMDVIPLPHPSGASPWHRMEPGKTRLAEALELIRLHPAMRQILRQAEPLRKAASRQSELELGKG